MKNRIILSLGLLLNTQYALNASVFDNINQFLSWLNNYTPEESKPNEYTMTLAQARSYVAQYIASIQRELNPNENDIKDLKKTVYTTIKESTIVFQTINNHKWYSKDKIDQIVISGLLDLIKNKSYQYAYSLSRNSTTAHKIATSMRNNALAIIQKHTVLNLRDLRPFFGSSLKQKIEKELSYVEFPYTPSAPPMEEAISYSEQPYAAHYYPSEACCVCFEKFDIVERVFLKPCGHDMCKICALEWFYEHNPNQTKTCPLCRSWVNLDQLGIDLDI